MILRDKQTSKETRKKTQTEKEGEDEETWLKMSLTGIQSIDHKSFKFWKSIQERKKLWKSI